MANSVEAAREPALVRSLLTPAAYPHPVFHLHLRETHASYLFFTGDTVYKIKKPVDLGFLDFTTLARRFHYCRREVELNRRISPEVYLGVVPITRLGDDFRVEGRGRPSEYAVKMRQLPEERSLAQLLRQDRVSRRDIERVADTIAGFHLSAPTNPDITRHGDLATVARNVQENFQQTRKYIGISLSQHRFDDLKAYSRAFLRVRAGEFEQREREGRIRDGHGDLHAENVFLTDGVKIIDCIEFNQRFRCLDVAEDVAFLAMDLDFFRRPDLSGAFVSRYVEKTGDRGLWILLNFFKVYRAHVKGKVASFRLDQLDPAAPAYRATRSAARSYFRLAYSYLRQARSAPTCYCFMGLMGTGKTVLGRELARRWNLEYVSSDVMRKQLAGSPVSEHKFEPYGQGIYSQEQTRSTYHHLIEQAGDRLRAGKSVVLDASFSKNEFRRRAAATADKLGARIFFIECRAPLQELERRLERRLLKPETTASDGRWELLRRQSADWEDVHRPERTHHLRLDTSLPLQRTLPVLLEQLYERILT